MNHPKSLPIPNTSLCCNVDISALRYDERPLIVFHDTQVSFRHFQEETERIAGYLQQDCGVKKGDRVLLHMQNSPQFMLAMPTTSPSLRGPPPRSSCGRHGSR